MSTAVPQNDARVSDIARQIRGAAAPFVLANGAKLEAGEMLQDASKAETAIRENILVALASYSQVGQWTIPEITAAAAKAAAMSDGTGDERGAKALATFISETKRAMNPKVRAFVPDLVMLRDAAWQSETEQLALDKGGPKPLRKAFSRQYHMLSQMFGEAQEGRVFTTEAEVRAWAIGRDPDHNVDKIEKRLKAIRDEITSIHGDWPVGDLSAAVATLEGVGKTRLEAARKAVVSSSIAFNAAAPTPQPGVLVTDTEAPTETEEEIVETPEPMSAQDEFLRDMLVS